MQGGLIFALADEAIAHAMISKSSPDEIFTTVELKSNFLTGVSSGELTATLFYQNLLYARRINANYGLYPLGYWDIM